MPFPCLLVGAFSVALYAQPAWLAVAAAPLPALAVVVAVALGDFAGEQSGTDFVIIPFFAHAERRRPGGHAAPRPAPGRAEGPRPHDLRPRRVRLGGPARRAGGFLLKDTPPAKLVDAVRTVAVGESLLAP